MANTNGVMTILPPPEGYVVDFANPQRRLLGEAYALFIVENILAFIFLAQRLFTKIRLMKQFQIDDAFVILAWILSIATQALLIRGFVTGVIGVHAWEISISEYGYYSRLILAAPLTYAPCCALTKITLCIFYSRLSPVRGYQIAVWSTVFICAGAYTAIFFSLLFACKPIAASWDPLLLPTAVCTNRGGIYIATAVIGVVTDVILIAIPIPTIWRLQMPTKQKIGLTIVFAIGSITMVTSIIRLVVLLPALTEPDQTWIIAVGCVWIIVESNLLIICCSLPTLRRFFRHVAPRMIGESSRGSSGKGSSGQNRMLHSWKSSKSGPKRQYDTLMNTIDGGDKGDDEIPLSGVKANESAQTRESKIQVGSRQCKDSDSEEAILYERTVEVTYEGLPVPNPPDPRDNKAWTGGRGRVSEV
ncbi:hypothetical protein COCMIDRAFT_35794 [Bipolaris oryzae ATCC 44560]|uniref:Rhodopsin domain-containing protein n=1 Tax=Bipolaris oryzae ATCC 44560 TaxID=930090 RepID=W6Z9V6_COCMI|nr:uncharacterized protein COCMIDRAFT_35794 [Bipolaris oryzae ATCC 44560]EUC46563.1 hypothetical protein COCMIDRAFT_35794 [Bipolaris oryzae ATCC 44560]